MDPQLPQRYKILHPLGQGGQGSVWLAIDQLAGGVPVAVKVLDGRHDADRFAPLAAEFLTLSKLAHPSIVRVWGFGSLEDSSGAYLASEYVEGPDLLAWAARIDPARLGGELLDVAAQLLSVLHYLELRGLEHGDVKPLNILVEREEGSRACRWVPRLIDFGLARLVSTAHLAVSQGTPAYLPPSSQEGDRIRPDLYALGLSLFHAATGRLPFPLGNEKATQAWKTSGQVADVRTSDREAPAALDELVAGLTGWPSRGGFRTAREALERLKGRVPCKPLPRPRLAEQTWFPCREAFVHKLLAAAEQGGVHLLAAPAGTGKSRVLESIAMSLQAMGWEVILLRGAEDAQPLEQVRQACSSGPSRRGARRLAVLLDEGDGASGELPLPLGAAVASALDSRKLRRVEAFLAACQSPANLAERLCVQPKALKVHVLENLKPESLAAALRQGFGIDDAPDDVVALLVRETGGMPLRVRAAIDTLRSQGATADFLGHLVIKRPLPDRLLAEPASDREHVVSLEAALRHTVGVLLAAGVPLAPAELAGVDSAGSQSGLQTRLEEACWRGWARSEERAGLTCYRATEKGDRAELARAALGVEESAVRRRLAEFFASRSKAAPGRTTEFLIAQGFNALALGDLRTAAAAALRASRKARRTQGQGDLIALYEEVSRGLELSQAACLGLASRRAAFVLRLRAAVKLLEGGQWQAALAVLPAATPERASVLTRIRWRLQALAHEQGGETAQAMEALEQARSEALKAPPSPETTLEHLAATARLAPLYFRAARPHDGQRALELGRAWLANMTSLATDVSIPIAANGAELSSTLALFATAEAIHGNALDGRRFLERAIGSARQIGREDLLVGPLNELGITHGQRQRWEDAELVFRELEAIARESGDRLGALRAVYNRAILRYRVQDLAPAETLFRSARELSDALGPHALAATVWLGLAGVLRERGQVVEALRLYRRVLRAHACSRPNDRAIAHNNLSELYLALGSVARSLRHAFEAHRLARQTENRFLLSLTLRTRGLARLAAGDPQKARIDLLRALASAVEENDARAQAEANHYLGLVEGLSGDVDSALKRLLASRAAAHGAADKKRFRGATLAVLLGLVRCGRTQAARSWLKRSSAAAGSCLARMLRAALDGSESDGAAAEQILQAARSGAKTGELGTAFFALAWLARSTNADQQSAPTPIQRELRLELDRWLFRLARRLSDRRQLRLVRFWNPQRWSPESNIARAPIAPLPPDSKAYPMLFRALSHGASPQEILESVLTDLLETLGARSVWLLLDPDRDRRAALILPQDARAETAVHQGRRLLGQSRAEDRVLAEPPVYVCRLPHPDRERALGIELAPGKDFPRPAIEKALIQSSAWAALALALQERDDSARESRLARDSAQSELRRLNADTAQGRQQLETAGISRRSEVKESDASDRNPADRNPVQSSRPSRQVSVAASPAMRAILSRLPRLAKTEIPILIIGESGVGKDWLARRIHELSPRAEKAFVAEICGIPESLMEAELFGHREGAFTDATSSRPGVFERARGGTIYLDEISSLSPTLQARLLRVIEEKRVRPLGAEEAIPVDFRLISSSALGVDELKEVADFRPELLFRVQGEVIEVPPLRDRPEDVPVLVEEILRAESRQRGQPMPYVHPEAQRALSEYSWPGNLRELVNEVQRMLVDDPVEITAAMVRVRAGASPRGTGANLRPVASVVPLREARRRMERDLLIRALETCAGNALDTARILKITRRYLTTLLSKHKLKLEEFQAGAGPSGQLGR